jgi:16S rRNA (guanine527-N7)-methyltransferase
VTSDEFRSRLLARAELVGAAVPPDALDGLETYFRLLARWNRKVNLTSLPVDPPSDDAFDRLLVEPIAASARIHPVHGADSPTIRWFDLGSGGGSPAIPLKLIRMDWALTMVESRERKAAFLREAVRTLELEQAEVANLRIEHLPGLEHVADLATVRAVKLDQNLAATVVRLLTDTAVLAIFGAKQAILPGFSSTESVQLMPASSLTLMRRVPRGT